MNSNPVIPMHAALQAYATTHLHPAAVTGAPRLANQGWESEVYFFSFSLPDAPPEERVLRLYAGGDSEKARREFEVIQRLRQAGYPVPQVYHLEPDPAPLGNPFIIMEKVQGEVLWQPLYHPASPQQGEQMLRLFARLYVRLHRLDPAPFSPSPAPHPVSGMLDSWQPYLTLLPGEDFASTWQWLRQREASVRGARPALNHFDFHANNILIRPDGSPAVIDWTGALVADPRYDLAWTLLLTEAYQGTAWRQRTLRAYEEEAGEAVLDLDFFDVAACLRRLFSILVSQAQGAQAMGMRPGAEQDMLQAEPIQRVYQRLQACTALPVPVVETLLARL